MLATLRSDGFPRISPLEPRMFEGQFWLGGMPNTLKFRDLSTDVDRSAGWHPEANAGQLKSSWIAA